MRGAETNTTTCNAIFNMKLNDSWELIGRRMRGLRRQDRITLREAADEVRKLRGHRIDLRP